MTKNLTDKTHVQRVTPKILFFVLLEIPKLWLQIWLHMFLLTVCHLKSLHYISTHYINYHTWKMLHRSVTCPSRGGAANLHAVKFLQTPTSVYFNTFKCRPKWLFYLSSCFNKLWRCLMIVHAQYNTNFYIKKIIRNWITSKIINKTMDNNGYTPFSSRICFMTDKSPNIKNERQK